MVGLVRLVLFHCPFVESQFFWPALLQQQTLGNPQKQHAGRGVGESRDGASARAVWMLDSVTSIVATARVQNDLQGGQFSSQESSKTYTSLDKFCYSYTSSAGPEYGYFLRPLLYGS